MLHSGLEKTKRLARFLVNQAANCSLLLRGLPVSPPCFAGGTLDKDDVASAREWLKTPHNWFDLTIIEGFEDAFAAWNGSKHATTFMGGRVALSACLHALNLPPGKEVIVPGYTCVVVPNAIRFAGLRTVFCDIELDTYGMDIASLKKKVSHDTAAIILQHLYGLVSRDLEQIIEFARQRNIAIIEDCAHATGAIFRNRKVGNFGDVAFLSSEHSKVFCTVQGGIAITNRDDLAERIRDYQANSPFPSPDRIEKLLHTLLLDYYQFKHPQRWFLGDVSYLLYGQHRIISTTAEEERGQCPAHYRQRMPAPVAALAAIQLEKIDSYNQMRRENAARWDAWCDEHNYTKPTVIADSKPVFLRYPLLVDPSLKYDDRWFLRHLGVLQGVWFRSHLHPAIGTVDGCPNANAAVAQCVNLPTLMS